MAQAIDDSQPVIRQHVTGRQDLIDAIAKGEFEALTTLTDQFVDGSRRHGLADLCRTRGCTRRCSPARAR
ncbi:hypothetical protein ACPL7H_10365 [Pseudactinotalea sp. Z1732]